MLTYCVRGERFCDGHWDGSVLRSGALWRCSGALKSCGVRSSDHPGWPDRHSLRFGDQT